LVEEGECGFEDLKAHIEVGEDVLCDGWWLRRGEVGEGGGNEGWHDLFVGPHKRGQDKLFRPVDLHH